jgi:hypothetical protein
MSCSVHQTYHHRGCLACEWRDQAQENNQEADFRHQERMRADEAWRAEQRKRQRKQQRPRRQGPPVWSMAPAGPAGALLGSLTEGALKVALGGVLALAALLAVAVFVAQAIFIAATIAGLVGIGGLLLRHVGRGPTALTRVPTLSLAQVPVIGVLAQVGASIPATSTVFGLGAGPQFSLIALLLATVLTVWLAALGRSLLRAQPPDAATEAPPAPTES